MKANQAANAQGLHYPAGFYTTICRIKYLAHTFKGIPADQMVCSTQNYQNLEQIIERLEHELEYNRKNHPEIFSQ